MPVPRQMTGAYGAYGNLMNFGRFARQAATVAAGHEWPAVQRAGIVSLREWA